MNDYTYNADALSVDRNAQIVALKPIARFQFHIQFTCAEHDLFRQLRRKQLLVLFGNGRISHIVFRLNSVDDRLEPDFSAGASDKSDEQDQDYYEDQALFISDSSEDNTDSSSSIVFLFSILRRCFPNGKPACGCRS